MPILALIYTLGNVKMNGNLDTSDVLLNRGLNGGYLGHGHGNFIGDGSAVKEAVRGNRDISLLDSVNQGTRDQFLSNEIDRGSDSIMSTMNQNNQFLTDRINSQSVNERFSSIERLLFAQQANNDRDFRALDVKLTECCCKLEAGQAAIQAKLDAQALQAAQAENQRLNMEIQIRNVQSSRGNGPGNS